MKQALVTGGANGIGRGIVLHLLDAGWRVWALDRDAAGLAALPDHPALHPLDADVADERAVAGAIARIDALSLLVANAGRADPVTGPVETLSLDAWQDRIGTNLTGTFLTVKHCVPLLRRAAGAIVTLSSTRARMSEPDCEAYAATKGGIEALTQALAVSLGPEIRVNGIAPGWIVTGDPADLRPVDHSQHPAGRAGRPEDVARAVAYLAEAGFLTGQILTLDGGMTRKMTYAPERALVIGASGGIGAALAAGLDRRGLAVTALSRSADGLDLTDEEAIRAALDALDHPFDRVVVATGALTSTRPAPEKSLADLGADELIAQIRLNALGPALVLKHLKRHVPRDRRWVFAALSARVGSIGDNFLGGWYSYRTSKAALNSLLHGAAVELARNRRQAIVACLHPGTVATAFTEGYDHDKVGPERAAERLIDVIEGLEPHQSGGFFDYSGQEIPW